MKSRRKLECYTSADLDIVEEVVEEAFVKEPKKQRRKGYCKI
jgi:hypothetical protein